MNFADQTSKTRGQQAKVRTEKEKKKKQNSHKTGHRESATPFTIATTKRDDNTVSKS
jgi:ribosomal protein L21